MDRPNRISQPRNKQGGVALLTALVVLAIASSLAANWWFNSHLNLARADNLHHAIQAKHLSQGLLLWASDLLREDYRQKEWPHDTAFDGWRQGIQGMPVEGALLSGHLQDMNGCFNVNNLVLNGQVSQPHLTYFKRLLMVLELDLAVADQLLDWMDADQVPLPQGAEDFVYLAKSPAHRAANQSLLHLQELQLLDRMTPDQLGQLLPHVCALPTGVQGTKMNVNTMTVPLLKALDDAITPQIALQVHQEGRARFTRLRDFFEHKLLKYLLQDQQQPLSQLIGVSSTHLAARAVVQIEDQVFEQHALLRRNQDGGAVVLSRSNSPYQLNRIE